MVSLRIAALLALVFGATSVLVMLAMDQAPLRDRLADVDALLALLALTLAAAWIVLQPLAYRLGEREAEVQRLAARVAEQDRALAAADRARRELLVNLSHDLRTPLASMQGYLELLLLRHGSLEPVEAQNYLQTAARQSERLARRVGDLFELTRLEAEGVQLQREPFPIAELAHDVVQRFAAAACDAGVALEVDAGAAGARAVQADLGLVERVLGNLVDNALRHTPAGGRVAIALAGADGGRVRVSVVDTGEGIAAADLPGVFERHLTAHRVGDTGSSNAGLGLAIARRIAALHGSTLELESRPGAGTRVTFHLPSAPRRGTA